MLIFLPQGYTYVPENTDEPVASVAGLSKRYGSTDVVSGISFTLPAGQATGLLGVNGAGKTTTMRMLVGLVRPTSGEVRVLGESAPFTPGTARRIGAALDSPQFYPWMNGRSFLRSLLNTAGVRDTGQVQTALERVELTEKNANKRIRSYSQGMRKRLALAAALLRTPDLLVLDEPTNGLDPQGIRLVRRLVREECDRGAAVLISSHQLDEIERICDQVVLLADGRVCASGPTAAFGFGAPGGPRSLEDWFFALHEDNPAEGAST